MWKPRHNEVQSLAQGQEVGSGTIGIQTYATHTTHPAPALNHVTPPDIFINKMNDTGPYLHRESAA